MAIDNFILLTGSDDMTIRTWNLVTFQPQGIVGNHTEPVRDLLFMDNGLLISCSYDKKIIAWVYNRGTMHG